MTWITITFTLVLALAAVVAFAAIVGSRLPRSHVGSRERTFPVPPDEVWSAITTIDAFPTWRSDVQKIERLPDRDGRPVLIETGRAGRITLATERMEPPRLLVLRIADPKLPFGGTWTYEIAPETAGSRLTITEHGEIYNPLFRFMARYIFGYTSTMDGYLSSLGRKFGQEVEFDS